MKKIIRDYLTFNKRDRNGVFILTSIIILLIGYLNLSQYFIKEEKTDFSEFEKNITLLQGTILNNNVANTIQNNTRKKSEKIKPEYFKFNPNNLPYSYWKKFGLSDKQIHSIKNYEAKGGRFKTKEDVKKMYGISEKMYLALEPYIQIPNKKKLVDSSKKLANVSEKIALIEINSADSALLEGLKGIGAFYAKAIIKYRNTLGGFVVKEQLMEVWKFDQEKYNAVQNYIAVDTTNIRKININTCTTKELKHPYLKWNTVNAIVNYRAKHGMYKSIEEIKETDVVDDETFKKIKPYLIVE